jgi:ABC-type lipoprotein release transport system permease subunit
MQNRAYMALEPLPELGRSPGFPGVFVHAHEGDVDAARAAIQRALPDSAFDASPALGPDEVEPIRSAIRYEGRGTLVLALLLALAAAVFAAQAVARQSRREWVDQPTLQALGITSGQSGTAAALRGAVIGLLAAVVAGATAVAASPLGPVGVARLTTVAPGWHVDLVVLGVGSILVVLVVVTAAWAPLRRLRRSLAGASAPRAARLAGRRFSPPVAAGLGMSRRGTGLDGVPSGMAIAGIGLAVATALAASTLVASLDVLRGDPERYGAPWDLSFAQTSSPEVWQDALARVRESAEIDAAAGIIGSNVAISSAHDTSGDHEAVVWAQSFAPVDGVARTIGAPVLDGRPPATTDEIALGTTTMRDLGVAIGDVVEVQATNTFATPRRLTVVGTTMVNDTFEVSPGRGAVTTADLMSEIAPESTPDPMVVRLMPGSDPTAVRAAVAAQYPAEVLPPTPQGAISNLERIRTLPRLLAVVVAGLALASLAHALVLSVRRNRRLLAVLRSLGFTRIQVGHAVATHATSLVLVGLAVGVPAGLVLGRWGWRLIETELGVGSPPATPLLAVVAAAVTTLVLANLVAAVPGWRGAQVPAAESLRTE